MPVKKGQEDEIAQLLGDTLQKMQPSDEDEDERDLEEGSVEEEDLEEEGEEEEEAEDEELKGLKEKVEKLEALLKEREGKREETEEEGEEDKLEPVIFVASDEDVKKISSSKDSLNAFANTVREKTIEESMRRVAKVIPSVINRAVDLRFAVNSFWDDNSDLIEGKSSEEIKSVQTKLAKAANVISSMNPEWSYKQVLDEAAVMIRGGAKKGGNGKRKKGGDVVAPSSRKTIPQKKAKRTLQDEIADVLGIK